MRAGDKGSAAWRALYAQQGRWNAGDKGRKTPGPLGRGQGLPGQLGLRRLIMGVVQRIVSVGMAAMAFHRPIVTVPMVAVALILARRRTRPVNVLVESG